ncbi:unnamed protein product [Urochloa humidicola]
MAFLALLPAMLYVLAAQVVHVIGQPGTAGFLSIDCGLDGSGYTDTVTGIDYVSDGPYVDTGENHVVAAEYQGTELQKRYLTFRSFPSGARNCYSLPTVLGTKYLARMETTLYGRNKSSPETTAEYKFDLYLGADYWDTAGVDTNVVYEAVFVAWASWTPACLVNTGQGTPFVSVVELRPLGLELYPTVTPAMSMALFDRRNMGANTSFRFPDDKYDRFWWPMGHG